MRSVILTLSRVLFQGDYALPDFPKLRTLKGLGISDSPQYARRLEERFDYVNTYYHQKPFLDLRDPPAEERGRYDFVICSDVLEHVPFPVEPAIGGLRTLLKPSGFAIVTVPYDLGPETTERFAPMVHQALATLGDKTVLVGMNAEGAVEVYGDLVFHIGFGSTLEHRQFSEAGLRSALLEQGFGEVRIDANGCEAFGVMYESPCSLPVVASAGTFELSRDTAAELAQELMRGQRTLRLAAHSRWVRLGRRLGLGPKLD